MIRFRLTVKITLTLYIGFPLEDSFVFLLTLKLKSIAATELLINIPSQLKITFTKQNFKMFIQPVDIGFVGVLQNQ